METIIKKTPAEIQLDKLQAETETLVDAYLKQVAADAHSPVIKTLLARLKKLREEQWQLIG